MMRSSASASSSLLMETPPTVVYCVSGTIWSPWPPSTYACTSFTETPSSHARNVRKRAVSSTPAMPTTRFFGKPMPEAME